MPDATGSRVPAEAAPEGEGEGARLVAALGDSIVAGSPGFDPDPAQRAALGFGDDEQSQLGYWAEQADPALSVRNCGVFGERTDEIAQRLDDCAEGADALLVQGGINDIAQALAQGPEAAVAAARDAAPEIDAMLERGKELGLELAVAEVLPWNNGHPFADDAIATLNDLIAELAREHDATLLGFHDALLDPDLEGRMAPDLTADGDHPSVEGYRVLGELTARELSPPK